MSEPKWAQVCQTESVAALSPGDYCVESTQVEQSAIDDYYSYVEHLLTLGHPTSLAGSKPLGRLLLLGLVTGVELYFRSVLAGVVELCPVSKGFAADQLVSFGAVEFYGAENAAWALFDATSLAGADEIRSRTKKILGIDLKQYQSLEGALTEFDKICHLRHAAVHARGVLGRGNAVALGLQASGAGAEVSLEFATLQAAGATCHSIVRAYNRVVYRKTVERWISLSRFTGVWSLDKSIFEPLFRLFHSTKDGLGSPNAYQAYRSLLKDLPA